MKNDLDQDELIIKKLTGSLSPFEADRFRQLAVSDEEFCEKFAAFQALWQDTAELEVAVGLSKEERWGKLNKQLESGRDVPKKTISLWPGRYAAALAFLIIATAAFFLLRLSPEWERVSTAQGEIKEVELPDHSLLSLNGSSSVKYDPSDWEEERIVYLQGEAFFQVTKTGAPFVVYANNTKIQVLGTSFNIKVGQGKVQIACTEGKVSVSSKEESGNGIVLGKGDGIELINDHLGEVYSVDVTQVALWRARQLIFQETSLSEVEKKLELYFGIHIEFNSQKDQLTFTGRFNNPQLEETLKTICLSAGLNYKIIDEENVLIY